MVIRDADRQEYIGALENADDGDLSALVKLFAKRQRSSVLAAIGLEQQVHQQGFAEEVISSALEVLKTSFKPKNRMLRVYINWQILCKSGQAIALP